MQGYTEVDMAIAEEYFAAGGKIHIQRTPTTLWNPWVIDRTTESSGKAIRSVKHAMGIWANTEGGNATLFIDPRDGRPANPLRGLA